METKRYCIVVEDEHGDAHDLGEAIGTFVGVARIAESLADKWESENGGEVQRVVLESLGLENQGSSGNSLRSGEKT